MTSVENLFQCEPWSEISLEGIIFLHFTYFSNAFYYVINEFKTKFKT